MENNLVLKEKFDVIFTEEEIDLLIKADEIEKRVSAMKDAKKEMLKQFLIENKLDSYENEKIRLAYTKAYERNDIDKEKLKAEGLYEMFIKKTPVKDSVKITIKYED